MVISVRERSHCTEYKLLESEISKEMNKKLLSNKSKGVFDNEYERLLNDDEMDEQRVDDEGALHSGDGVTREPNDLYKEGSEACTSKDDILLQPKLLPSKEKETRDSGGWHDDVGYIQSILNLKKKKMRMKETKTSNSLPQ